MYENSNENVLKPFTPTSKDSIKQTAPVQKKQTPQHTEDMVTPKSDVNVPEIG